METLASRAITILRTHGKSMRLHELAVALKLPARGGLATKVRRAIESQEAKDAGVKVQKFNRRHTETWLGGEGPKGPEPKGPAKAVENKSYKRKTPILRGTITGAVSAIVKSFGEKGCTMEDISSEVEKSLPQYRPTSASPAVSHLRSIGCVKEARHYGVRRIFHVRDFDYKKDSKKLARIAARYRKNLYTGGKARVQVKAETLNGSGAKLLIAVGETHTETMTVEEARALYEQLREIFGASV